MKGPAPRHSRSAPVERFRPPVVTAHEIVRLRLLDRLTTPCAEAGAARITLVRGPAGFGKTTLLAQAHRQVVARGETAVWLDCSELDSDPNHFLDSLYAAAASIGVGGESRELTPADLAGRLAQVDTPLYLFLDEFERLVGTPVEELLERLADGLPGRAHLIVASRQAPRSWFLRRELRGLAGTVEALDLRLTSEELKALLEGRFEGDELGQIEQLTEGWPMAVQLARLRSRDTIALRELLGSLQRGGLGLFEYLTERVVESLSDEQQRFLRDTSILTFVNPLAANEVMQRDDGYALLTSVMHLQPIVTITGDSELTIRLHPLFRQFMKDQLARCGQHRVAALHRRAAAFFAARGRTPEAVQHALDAGDHALAIEAVDRAGGEELILTLGTPRAYALLATLPPEARSLSLRVRLMELLLASVDGRALYVQVLVARFLKSLQAAARPATSPVVEHALAQDPLPAGQVPNPAWPRYARGICALMSAFLQDLHAGCARGSILDALELEAYCRRHFVANEASLAIVLAIEVLLFARCGEVAEARRCLQDYHSVCERNGYAPNLPSINPQRGMLEFLGGDFDRAQMILERSAELRLDRFAEPELLLSQLCKVLLGVILHERGQLADALVLIEGLRTDLDATLTEVPPLASRTRILCTQKLRGSEAADALLAEALLQAHKREAQRYIVYLRALRLELLHGRGAPAALVADEVESLCAFLDAEIACTEPSWPFLDQLLRALVPWLLVLQRSEQAQTHARQINEIAAATGRRHLQAVSSLLLARAMMPQDRRQATRTLREALMLTSETRVVQPYVDLAPQLGQLIVAALAGSTLPSVADHARTVMRLLDSDPSAASDNSDSWKALSERERDILLVLAAHASTKAAARALGLAPETVKHHLKRIYAKLGVHTRKEALAHIAKDAG